jgi:hypothetical protein
MRIAATVCRQSPGHTVWLFTAKDFLMRGDSEDRSQPAVLAADPYKCPMCQGRLIRTRRRVVDRVRSLFGPVKRYRCANFACQWHGNIAESRTDAWDSSRRDAAAPSGAPKQPSGRVPAAFVAHMVLVVLGVVFVLVFSSMDSVPWMSQPEQARDAVVYEPVTGR